MAVVSDTSPLRYFVATGHVDLIRQVFGPLIIPGPVLSELIHPSAPAAVGQYFRTLPEWISIQDPGGTSDPRLNKLLDPIQLASELKADFLLMDERIGRQEALRRGIPVVGALGVLREAHRRGLLPNLLQAMAQMRAGGFRLSRRLHEEFELSVRMAATRPKAPNPGGPE
jgi:hypothetical protein